MIDGLLTFFRGLRILRRKELVRRLGEMLSAEIEIEEIRRRNPGAKISSDVVVDGWPQGTLELATGSQVERGTLLNLGDPHNGFGSIRIGERTWIGPYNNFRSAAGTSIRIGAGCLVSQFCTVVAANHTISRSVKIAEAPPASDRRYVTIGDDVWLGAGVIVLPGVTIANGAVIAAGAIVTQSVGEYEIWAGNPARKIGERRA